MGNEEEFYAHVAVLKIMFCLSFSSFVLPDTTYYHFMTFYVELTKIRHIKNIRHFKKTQLMSIKTYAEQNKKLLFKKQT